MSDLLNEWRNEGIDIYYEPDTDLSSMGLAVHKTDMVPAFMTYALYCLSVFLFSP